MSRVVRVRGKGGPEVLHVEEREVPQPRRGQVRLRVRRAGVAFGDVMRRRGVLAPPRAFTPGYDVVGEVEAMAPDVTDLQLGARVAAMTAGPGLGGYADHACLDAWRAVPIPADVDDDTAIALGLNYITALQMIERSARLQHGQSLLVHGAAGGVGTAVLDLAAQRGLRTFGTASAGKHDHLRARGCEPIDYRSEDFVERIAELTEGGVDAVFDGIGGAHLRSSYAVLADGGTLVSFGISGELDRGLPGVVSAIGLYLGLKLRPDRRHVRMYNITVSRGCSPRHCRDDWEALLQLASEGALSPAVGACVPLAEVARAHQLMDDAAVTGKVLLDCEARDRAPDGAA